VTRVLRPPACEAFGVRPDDGEVIEPAGKSALRYERQRPGELRHVDVRSWPDPTGGGLAANGRGHAPDPNADRYDYVHDVDDFRSLLRGPR